MMKSTKLSSFFKLTFFTWHIAVNFMKQSGIMLFGKSGIQFFFHFDVHFHTSRFSYKRQFGHCAETKRPFNRHIIICGRGEICVPCAQFIPSCNGRITFANMLGFTLFCRNTEGGEEFYKGSNKISIFKWFCTVFK